MDRSVFTYYSTLLWGSAPHKCQIRVEFLVYKEEKLFLLIAFSSLQFSHSVVSDSLWPQNRSTPGLPVYHQHPEFTQTHVHWVDDAFQPSHPLSLLPLLPSVFLSIRVFSSESVLRIRWPKYCSFSFSISPSDEYSGFISFRIDWFGLLAVQRTLKSLLQHHNLKASNF